MKRALSLLMTVLAIMFAAVLLFATHARDTVARAVYVGTYRVQCFGHDLWQSIGESVLAYLFRTGAAMAVFPGTVPSNLGFGVVGELAFDGPYRSQPARINWGMAADIVIGRWFTLAADGTTRPGGAGAIGGVLMSPKTQAALGAGGVPLAPTMTLVTGTIGELCYMGAIVVQLAGAVAIGDAAKYNTTTGVIGSGAPGAGEAAVPNSKFIRYANAAAGLAVLEITN